MLRDHASVASVVAQANMGRVQVTLAGQPAASISAEQATKVRLDLLDRGYSPVPARGKQPAVSSWPRFAYRPPSVRAIENWQQLGNGNATNTGIACGCIRVIDLDIDDKQLCAEAQEIVREETGERGLCRVGRFPRVALFFRQLGDPRKTFQRAYERGGVDYIGRKGHVIVHGIHPETGHRYDWPETPIWEVPVTSLPTISRDQENRIGVRLARLLDGQKKAVSKSDPTVTTARTALIPEGQRNLHLSTKLHQFAGKATSEAELQAEAERINDTCFEKPLEASEVGSLVRYWWRIKEDGKLLTKGGEPTAFVKKSEHEKICNPNATSLLLLLRLHHGHKRGVRFAIVPEKMTTRMGIGIKPIRAARDHLMSLGLIRRVGGAGRLGNPYQYVLT